MMIKDLEMSKDLDRDALSAVRGGNSIQQGGIYAPVANASGGFSFGSPTTVVSAPVTLPAGCSADTALGSDCKADSEAVTLGNHAATDCATAVLSAARLDRVLARSGLDAIASTSASSSSGPFVEMTNGDVLPGRADHVA